MRRSFFTKNYHIGLIIERKPKFSPKLKTTKSDMGDWEKFRIMRKVLAMRDFIKKHPDYQELLEIAREWERL